MRDVEAIMVEALKRLLHCLSGEYDQMQEEHMKETSDSAKQMQRLKHSIAMKNTKSKER